nr:cell wall-binding repeat-containing protein [Ornithinimicrobium sp. F0845]
MNAIAPTERVYGADRYQTAAALTAGYGTDGDVLYIASGVNFPDALAGSSLTGSQQAPLLLTKQGHLPAATAEEILRLSPQGITIFGGEVAVNAEVEAALQALLDQTSTD